MVAENLVNILRLLNTDGIGPVTFYKLLEKHGNIPAALEAISAKKTVYSQDQAEQLLADAEKKNVKIIPYTSPEYPQTLLQISDAPPVIYALGNTELLNYPYSVAIVGARNASIAGRKIASRIAYDLTQADVLVVSGMARGIDAAAHKGALYAKQQQGPTVAVLGTGVDEIYPAENTELYQDICRQGLAVSEFAPGTKAQVSNFPRRNRIISALTQGILVAEASLNSGSLITARLALEQGKDIFAVPGSPLENRAAGPNRLIKEGAILTESAEDILNVLSISQNRQIKIKQTELFPLDKAKNNVNISEHKNTEKSNSDNINLLDLISYEGVDIDVLLRTSQLSQADFFSQILDLEFSGKIQRQAGNKVARIK